MACFNIESFNMEPADTDKDMSFGIELEFLFYWRRTPYDENNAPPSLVTREEELAKPFLTGEDEMDGMGIIRKLLRDNGIHVQGDPETFPFPPFPSIYLDPKTGWVVKTDSSVREDAAHSGLRSQWMMPGYEHLGIEINSPILRDVEEAYEHVHQVVRLLTDNLHIRVNPSCGLHVHVGAGTRLLPNPSSGPPGESYQSVPFDFRTLRRAAMLLWAADPTIAALHPPERHFNPFTHNIRKHSALARGTDGKPVGESRLDPVHPIPAPPLRFRSLDTDERVRLPIFRADPDPATAARCHLAGIPCDKSDDVDVVNSTVQSGVTILHHRARNRQQIALLLSSTHRMNYNFNMYGALPVGFESPTGIPFQRTVEFREAAGSVDADWVCVWARICTGIFSFCRDAEEKRFRRVIVRLAAAEENKGGYDVVDLLRDLGLFAEAEYVIERHKKGLKAWYPGRIDFLPGDALYQELCFLRNRPSTGRKVGDEVKLKRKTKEDLDEARSVSNIADVLEHCPEYRDVYLWLKQMLKDGGFEEEGGWELERPPTPEWTAPEWEAEYLRKNAPDPLAPQWELDPPAELSRQSSVDPKGPPRPRAKSL